MTVGTISGKSTLDCRSRRRSSDADVPGTTFAGSFCGVWSTGAEASVPWNV